MRQALPVLLAQFFAMVDSTAPASISNQISNDPTNPGIEIALHCATLGFRDQGDTQQFVEKCHPNGRFFDTSNTSENDMFRVALEQCGALGTGGGDACEDVAAAFERAANWHWKSPVKFMVLVTDNPCHGRTFIRLALIRSRMRSTKPQTAPGNRSSGASSAALIRRSVCCTARAIPGRPTR